MIQTAKHNRLVYLYTAPAIMILSLVVLYPFIYNIFVSLSNMNLSHFRDWEIKGFQNYLAVLVDSSFWYYLFKAILWTGLNLIFHVAIGVFLAIILNKDLKGKTFYRTLFFKNLQIPSYGYRRSFKQGA